MFSASHNILFAKRIGGLVNAAMGGRLCYYSVMTKLLEDAIDRLRQLPDALQDSAARAVIQQLEEEPERGDLEEIAAGWDEYGRGEFVTLDQLRHEMGPSGR